MNSTIKTAGVVATAIGLAAAPATPQAQGTSAVGLTYEQAVRCAAAYSGDALYAVGPRQQELVAKTGLAFRRADDLGRAKGLQPTKVYDDFGAAGIALRREPRAVVQALQAQCASTAAAPISIPVLAGETPTCKAVKAILAAGGEATAFKSISGPAKGGATPGRLVAPGFRSCTVYASIKTYSCAVLDLTPKAGWDQFYKVRGEVEACTGKPLLYDFTRSGKGGMARLGAGEKPRVSAGVTELDGKAMVTLTVETP